MGFTDDDDDDDFNFDYESLSEEEKAEIEKEMREKDEQRDNHPLFKKANDIIDLVTAIVESLPEGVKEIYESTLTESAYMLAPKLAGAMGSESWLICMQNGALIRYHAEYLLTATSGLKMFMEEDDVKINQDYIALMRKEMLEFQKLFVEWTKEFNKLEREEYTDEWGLFLRP